MMSYQSKLLMIVSHSPSLLGFRSSLIEALQTKGVKVHVAAPDLGVSSTLRKVLQAKGLVVHDIPLQRTKQNAIYDIRSLFALLRVMLQVQPDYVLSFTIKPVIYGSIAAWIACVPKRFAIIEGLGFVFTSDGNEPSYSRKILKILVLSLYKLGLACANKVILLNKDDRNELVDAGVLDEGKSFILGGIGVDLVRWHFCPQALNPPTFLLVARLLREKGVIEYCKAAKIIKQQYPKTRFILLGGLDENPGALTEADIYAWVTEGILEWPGHVPVQPWMKLASVFVLPSYREGVPASTQEAMASGRAIITTDVPGCRETVVDGDNGFLVPARDVEALVRAMLQFLVNPQFIARMGLRSRQMAEEKYDVHKINTILLQELGICS